MTAPQEWKEAERIDREWKEHLRQIRLQAEPISNNVVRPMDEHEREKV
jgi:hypothetical protein